MAKHKLPRREAAQQGLCFRQFGAFIIAMKMKGETPTEIAGLATAMRDKSLKIDLDEPLLDTCGTGGDGLKTFNISTAVAFVVAVIVMSSSSDCAFVLNNPPLRKFPLFASGGTTVPCASPRYCTNIFPVPLDGAAENVNVVPSVAM